MKKKNPVLKQKYDEGYAAGFKNGLEQGKYAACVYFANRFTDLEKVKGIGPKTTKLIAQHFGKEYFKAVKK